MCLVCCRKLFVVPALFTLFIIPVSDLAADELAGTGASVQIDTLWVLLSAALVGLRDPPIRHSTRTPLVPSPQTR